MKGMSEYTKFSPNPGEGGTQGRYHLDTHCRTGVEAANDKILKWSAPFGARKGVVNFKLETQ